VPVPPEDNGILLGLAVAPSPDVEALTEIVTVFENPFKLARDMLEVADPPCAIVIELGLALMLKSTTLTVIVTE
jgi:hypothetical protein